ncbi:hypothetical protein J437_LFUL001348 [Ladona fulva]|uniref:Uncharacterized protein n=1 Tax=Ladona fulva TaxID=123851 RepID=A0A8K0NV34_LADFU|nr:hypothetical protein J437_LFUL001348 [Ladona fulva]
MQVENSLSTYAPHACVVVYSVVDRATFKAAEDTLRYLWKENFTMEKAVILVGNKADLARARTITTQGCDTGTGASMIKTNIFRCRRAQSPIDNRLY